MSSTNRGGVRVANDVYPTPGWASLRFLESEIGENLPGGIWLEAGAGEGAIISAVQSVRSDVRFLACELREECRPKLELIADAVHIGNFLGADMEYLGLDRKADVMIGNPPFHLAMEFIAHGFTIADRVVQLLRLNFVGSDERAEFMRTFAPDLLILPNRPGFSPDGGTDSCEYAWLNWPMEKERRRGVVEVLAKTPLSVRRAAVDELKQLVGEGPIPTGT